MKTKNKVYLIIATLLWVTLIAVKAIFIFAGNMYDFKYDPIFYLPVLVLAYAGLRK